MLWHRSLVICVCSAFDPWVSELAAGTPSKTFPMGFVLASFRADRFVCVCADRISDLCGAIANAYGCKLDEGSVHPCVIKGQDYGELLYSLGVMGWFMLVTIPGGLVAFASWLIFLILHRVAWRRRFAVGVPPPISAPPAAV